MEKPFILPGYYGSITKPQEIENIQKPVTTFEKIGRFNLNNHIYVLGVNQSIDGVKINTPELYHKTNTLYYLDEVGKHILLNGSLMEKTLISSSIKYFENKQSKQTKNEITPRIDQIIGNKVIDVDYITKVKYTNPETFVQKNSQTIMLVGIIFLSWYFLDKK